MKNKKDAGAIAMLGEQNENVHEVVALIQRFFAMLNQEISVDDVHELVNHFKALGRLPKEYSALANSIRTKLNKVLAIAAQNKFYRINLEVADQKFFTKVADTIAQSSYFDTENFNQTTQCYALNYPVSKLHTDTKRFQNRKDAFSEVSARQVAENFDVNKFDPIVVWQDATGVPAKAKKVFILSGHSRYEGLKRRKAKTVPVRFFEGTEAEAIQFAKVEANRSAEKESLSEDLNAFRLLRDGDKAQNIVAVSREQIKEKFGSRAPSLELFTYLNQSGLFLQALSNDNISEFPHLERNARWVGQLRREYPKISNLMEDNAFNFFYADKQGKNVKIAKDDFTKLVADRLNTMKPEEKLLFTQDGETITEARRLIEDKLKGEGFKRLKEINEILKFLSDRLTTTDRKIKVWTGEEDRYIREELSEKLREEKKRIERDLNYLSEQETLFGLAGCIPCALTARRVGAAAVRRIAKSELSKRAKQAAITAAKEVAKEAAEKIMDVAKGQVKKQGRKGKAKLKKKMGLGAAPRTARQSKGLNGVLPPVAELPVRRAAVLTARPTGVPATDVPPVSVPPGAASTPGGRAVDRAVMPHPVPGADALFQTIGTRREDLDEQPMFTLPGNVGRFLGRIEQKNYAVVIRGEKGAGKSTLQFRIMDSLAEWGLDVAYITLEMSPESNLMAEMTAKYIREENKHKIKATDQVKTVSEVDAIAKHFGAVVLDSWSKLQGLSQQDFEDLFKANPTTLFFIIFQSTTAGTARGGSMSEYDGSAVIQVNKSENGGIAEMEKNRYSDGKDYRYNVHTDQIYFS